MKNNLDTQVSYKCNKCSDKTFILVDNEAIPCECRALKESESILRNSGISDEFSKKTFRNFNIVFCQYYNVLYLNYKGFKLNYKVLT